MTDKAERKLDGKAELPCNIFGFPITWSEEAPTGNIVVLADWLTYLTFKKKVREYDPEAT